MVITMAQRKGGSGKSTIGTSLAAELARRGHSVGLLDTDSQRSATKWYARRQKKHDNVSSIECRYTQGDIVDTIDGMAKRNDFLIIDTAGFHSDELRQALVRSQLSISPFRPKQYDLEVAGEQMKILTEIRFANPNLVTAAVLNMAPTNSRDTRSLEAFEFLRAKKYHVYTSRMYNREAYGDAGQEGLGVTEYIDAKAFAEIVDFTQEVLNHASI